MRSHTHRRFERSSLLLLLCLAFPIRTFARVVVVPSDSQSAGMQAAVRALQGVVPSASSVALKDLTPASLGTAVAVALGDSAARADYPSSARLVVALVYDPALRPGRDHVRVSMLPDAFFLLGKIRDIIPRLDRLGALVSPGAYKDYLKYLTAAGKITGSKLQAREVSDAAGLVEAMRGFAGNVDALWVAPDPAFIAPDRFKLISEFCLANKIALFAPVSVLARAGALAAIAPSDAEAGKAAGEAARDLEAGKAVDKLIQLDRCEVLINGAVAKALGYTVPARAGTWVE